MTLMVAAGALAQAPAGPTVPAGDAGPPPPTASRTGKRIFIVDGVRSQLVLQVFKEGAAAVFAHDHVVQATEIAGAVIVDDDAPEASLVTVTVQSGTLVADDPQLRKQFGLEQVVPEDKRASVTRSMRSESVLDVAKFPIIRFVGTSAARGEDGSITLVGDFTLHGVTRTLTLPVTVTIEGRTLTGAGKVRFKTSDWGMKPYTMFFGAVKNRDEVVLNVVLVAVER